jgi:hypothetical protein
MTSKTGCEKRRGAQATAMAADPLHRLSGEVVVAELIPIYRYHIARENQSTETRWSLAPVRPSGYAGDDEPSDAHPMSNEPADVSQMLPDGQVEVPNGTTVISMDPPILDIPGRGRVMLEAAIGVGEGHASELGHLIRWRPS